MKKIIGFLAILLAFVGLVACDDPVVVDEDPTDQEIVDAAKQTLTLGTEESLTAITSNITLTLSASGGVVVTWESSNTAVVAINNTNAIVTRPDHEAENASVKLRATLTLREATATKEFDLVVLKKDAPVIEGVTTVAEVLAAGVKGNTYKLYGVISQFIYKDDGVTGFFVTDGTGTAYVYGSTSAQLGDKVLFSATYGENFGFSQFASPTDIQVISSGVEPDFSNGVIKGKTIGELFGANQATDPTIDYGCQVFELDGKVVKNQGTDSSTGNPYVSYALDDPSSGSRVNIYFGGNSQNLTRVAELFGHLDKHVGKVITVYFTSAGRSSSGKGTYRGAILLVLDDIVDPDLETAKAALETLSNPFDVAYKAAATVTLPTVSGHTVTWESSDDALVALTATTATISLPATGLVSVNVTASITVNGKTASKTFTLAIGTIDLSGVTTIAGIYQEKSTTKGYQVHGVVSGVVYGTIERGLAGFFLTDATGTIYVYVGGNAFGVALEKGDEVVFMAKYTTNKDYSQLTIAGYAEEGVLLEKDKDFDATGVTGETIASINSKIGTDIAGTVYELEGKLTFVQGSGFTSVSLEDPTNETVKLGVYVAFTVPQLADIKALLADIAQYDGQIIKVLFVVCGTNSSATNFRGSILKVIPSEANPDLDQARAIINGLTNPFSANYTAAATVTLPTVSGHTLNWDSSNDTLISIAGNTATVALPTVPGDQTVNVVVSVTVGAETVSKTFAVTVTNPSIAIPAISWAEYMSAAIGADLVVEGIVSFKEPYSASFKNATVYFSDADGGYSAYRLSFEDEAAYNALEVGMKIQVTGKKGVSNSLHQIAAGGTFTIVDTNKTTVVATDVSDLVGTAEIVNSINTLITIENFEVVSKAGSAPTGSYNIPLKSGSKTIEIRVATAIIPAADADFLAIYNKLSAGALVKVTGILSVYNTTYQIFVRSEADVELASDPDYLAAKAAVDALGTDIFAAEYDAAATVTLPGTSNEKTLVWESSDDAVIAIENLTATVIIPASGIVTVVVTVSCTINSSTAVREYSVSVVGNSLVFNELTVIKAYTEATGLTIQVKVVAVGELYLDTSGATMKRLIVVTDGVTNMIAMYPSTEPLDKYEVGKAYVFTGETKTGNVSNTPVNYVTRFEIATTTEVDVEIASVAPITLTFNDAESAAAAAATIDVVADAGLQYLFTSVKFLAVNSAGTNSNQSYMYSQASNTVRLTGFKATLPEGANTTDTFTFTAYYLGANGNMTNAGRILRFGCFENFAVVA